MGIAAPAIVPIVTSLQFHNLLQNSMSQDYHQGVFSFSNGFERSQPQEQPQIRRDKLRVPGFDAVGIEEESSAGLPVYESAGMLSEMFNFPPATELLENQILQSYRNSRAAADWFSHRQGMVVGGGSDLPDSKNHQDQQQQISGINGDSAAAMQLFLTNPQHQHQTSPSPSPSPHPPPASAASTSSTLHMLLPNPPSSSGGGFGQFPWVNVPSQNPGVVEGQGLSLSLSSSLQHLDATKGEEFRIGEGEMLYFGGGNAGALNFQGGVGHHNHHQLAAAAPGIGSPYGTAAVSMVRNSKYAKAAQELLEEFCCVGRGQLRKNKFSKQNNNTRNPNSNTTAGAATSGGGDGGASSSKDIPPLSAADRLEHQRRKVKLLSMLDEVDRRYSHYCEQMQMVVNSFDMLMGYGAAAPYTSLAQKAMSRHFRCLKDAVTAQLKQTCELLGEKDATASSGVTKGETPRLRILDQSLRQQRAFHQMGMMEQEAWRPQRGLPERSVNILRAWLFEHFLHPYPSDADKHLLARQTGLSRNQVSNWFINARVRLWKPMVEDMYQQEAKEDSSSSAAAAAGEDDQTTTTAQTSASTVAFTGVPAPEIINAPGNYTVEAAARTMDQEETVMESAAMMSFGASSGDVSLTLGLRHAGNLPEKGSFSVRDFGGF